MKESGIKPVRRVFGDLLLVLTVLLTADLCFVMPRRIAAVVLKGVYRTVFLIELILCAVLLVFALDIRFGILGRMRSKAGGGIGWILRVLVACLSAAVLFFGGRVVVGSLVRSVGTAEHAVVLGLALENGQPPKDLLLRVETARDWLEQNPGGTLILTGGNPDESGRTEAAVMRDLLTEQGAPEDRMILEDRARSTEENFENSAALLPPGEPVVLISSDYHMDRAVRIAKKTGFSSVLRFPAPSDPLSYGSSLMWEVVQALAGMAG